MFKAIVKIILCFIVFYVTFDLEAKSSDLNVQALSSEMYIKQIKTMNASSYLIESNGSLWAWGSNEYGQLGDGTTNFRLKPVKVLDNVDTVSVGYFYTLAIKSDGSLWAWGRNRSGELGIGLIGDTFIPIKIMDDVTSVTAGYYHTMAIKSDGSLWSWGDNEYGQLGSGTTNDQLTPVMIMDKVKSVSAGSLHTVAVKTDGSLWTWGRNNFGQLGNESNTDSWVPYEIMSDVSSVSVGYDQSFAIKTDSSLWAWGDNSNGQIGIGSLINQAKPIKVLENVSSVTTGNGYTLAIKTDQSLWSWGKNTNGQLGTGNLINQVIPVKILENISSVTAGNGHTLALGNDSVVWAWGSNNVGQLGDGTDIQRLLPEVVTYGFDVELRLDQATLNEFDLSVGDNHSMFVKTNGSLWAWGENSFGQLGTGFSENELIPRKILNDVLSVEARANNTFAIREDYSLWGWGKNNNGELGNGEIINQYIPEKIMEDVVEISSSGRHTMVIRSDRSLWSWGENSAGQLGDGTNTNQLLPLKVLENVLSVSAGDQHTLAIKLDNSLWVWGANYVGQLGETNVQESNVPIKIMDDVAKVEAGNGYSLALKTDGSLWAWGYNYYGQIGNGTTVNQYVPMKILEEVKDISTGDSTSVAIKVDDSLWVWGYNETGNLNVGTTTNQLTPTKIMENINSVSVGLGHTLVIKKNGSLWGWGNNNYGQLGTNFLGYNFSPFQTLPSQLYYDTKTSEEILLPIYVDSPEFFLNHGDDINARFVITSQDVYGNITMDSDNRVLAKMSGSAVINVMSSTGSYIYQTINVIAYDEKPRVLTNYPVCSVVNQPIRFTSENSSTPLLNNVYYSGELVSEEGIHVLKLIDLARFEFVTSFSIDFTPPIITVLPYSTTPTNQEVLISVSTNDGELNETTHTFYENGSFTFIATDKAGNASNQIVTISHIDKEPPNIIGVSDYGQYNTPRTITFTEGIVTLDGEVIESGAQVSSEGTHQLQAHDSFGNTLQIQFTLDFTSPIISIEHYDTNPISGPITVTASTNEGTLNATSHTFTENGSFEFIATDEADNVTSKIVTITNIVTAQMQVESFISRFYELVLNRTTDPWGLNDWTTKLLNGERSGADVANGFVFSDEFKDRGVSDEQYVNIMYEAFFNRSADAGGYANWMDALSQGMSRYYVLRGFTDSQEFKDLASSYGINPGSLVLSQPADLYPDITAFVTRFYKETLNRMPDEGGLNDWVNQLQQKTRSGADVAYGFIFSDEFKAKNLSNDLFVKTLYSAFFGREADEGGYNDWMNRLASGQTREQVLKGFLGSAEFRDLCTKYGINPGI